MVSPFCQADTLIVAEGKLPCKQTTETDVCLLILSSDTILAAYLATVRWYVATRGCRKGQLMFPNSKALPFLLTAQQGHGYSTAVPGFLFCYMRQKKKKRRAWAVWQPLEERDPSRTLRAARSCRRRCIASLRVPLPSSKRPPNGLANTLSSARFHFRFVHSRHRCLVFASAFSLFSYAFFLITFFRRFWPWVCEWPG